MQNDLRLSLYLDCMHRDQFIDTFGDAAYSKLPPDAFLPPEAPLRMFDVMNKVIDLMPEGLADPVEVPEIGPRDYITHMWLVENRPRPVTESN